MLRCAVVLLCVDVFVICCVLCDLIRNKTGENEMVRTRQPTPIHNTHTTLGTQTHRKLCNIIWVNGVMAHAPSSARSDLSMGRYAMWHIERVAFPLLHLYYYIFFFISSFGVKQTYNWHRLFFTLSLTLSLFCSLCVFVYVSHARPFSVNEQQQPRHAGKTKKYIRKWDSTATESLGWGVVVPRHGVIRIFFVVFSLSVCVLLTLCHPFYRSYDTFIYSYRPFGEKQTYAWLRICFLYIFMAGKV